ncbi:MAG: DUF29 domain-containing protein [Lautropia sp.]|nr:DUF29 domain-containing protein [Lautropia sp.]
MSTIRYTDDIVAWANQQAALIRAGQFDQLDLEHIADEIEDVGKSEQRELASRLAVLLGHLLKWHVQPNHRSRSWQLTIKAQRKELSLALKETPSLKTRLTDEAWLDVVWSHAVALAARETGLDDFPEALPWAMQQVLDLDWMPDQKKPQA